MLLAWSGLGSGVPVFSPAGSVVPFVCPPANLADNNSFYEAASVLVNLAVCCLNQASAHIAAPSTGPREGVEKECYAVSNEAAGCLQLALQLLTQHVPRQEDCLVDMLPDFVEGLQKVALAQAQELGFLRALDKERNKDRQAQSPGLLCKLAHQCRALYEEACPYPLVPSLGLSLPPSPIPRPAPTPSPHP